MIGMSEKQPADPMHGMTLEKILQALVEHFGWPELGRRIAIRCFNHEPSIKSSLVFASHAVGAQPGGSLVCRNENPPGQRGRQGHAAQAVFGAAEVMQALRLENDACCPNCSRWRCRCSNGHLVARSVDQEMG
jgi:hypothetical protein